jgi:hypothetical protein
MPIVTISRQSYTQAREVAERVARELGFECISREVLIEASKTFDVPEIKLLRAIRDAPSVLDRFTFGKERYTAYLQSALLEHLQKDDVVYHGLAGHYLVTGVDHVLRVRILGKQEDRVKAVMQRAETFERAASAMKGISGPGLPRQAKHGRLTEGEALRVLEEIDEARRRWGLHLYGIDTRDPSLYDVVIHVDRLSLDDAADLVCRAARSRRFRATAESKKALYDLLIAARIKARLVEDHPRVKVAASGGSARIVLEGGTAGDEKAIRRIVEEIPGVEEIEISVFPIAVPD